MIYTKKQVKKALHNQVIACAHVFAKQPQSSNILEKFEAIKKTGLVTLPKED